MLPAMAAEQASASRSEAPDLKAEQAVDFAGAVCAMKPEVTSSGQKLWCTRWRGLIREATDRERPRIQTP